MAELAIGINDLGSRRRELSGNIKICAFVTFTLYPLVSRIDASRPDLNFKRDAHGSASRSRDNRWDWSLGPIQSVSPSFEVKLRPVDVRDATEMARAPEWLY